VDSIGAGLGDVVAKPVRKPFFKCTGCAALYQVVRAEAGPETREGDIACCICGAPLAARDGEIILKYFLLRKAIPPEHRRRYRQASDAGSQK
jgi:hypothetical protein